MKDSRPADGESRWNIVIRVVVLLFVIALTVILVLNRNRIQDLEKYGYPGLFLVTFFRAQRY